MRIASSSMMRNIDNYVIDKIGMPSIVLMENACIEALKKIDLEKEYYVIICGPGNNGGDGFAIARHLYNLGKDVDVYIYSNKKEDGFKGDARTNFNILKHINIPYMFIEDEKRDLWILKESLCDSDIVIDALFGTGFIGKNNELLFNIIESINSYSDKVISIDVPSGLNSDTGEIFNSCVIANRTITFQCMKRGFLNYRAFKYIGEVDVVDIGIPEFVEEKFESLEYILDYNKAKKLIPIRQKTGYKGNYGRVLIVAGSLGFTGAAILTSEAAISSGSGLVSLTSHKESLEVLVPRLREIMSVDIDRLENEVKKSSVVAIGPGLGDTKETYKILLKVIKVMQEEGKEDSFLIIDADGLNVLKGRTEILKHLNFNVIITPHLGEMARLTGLSIEEISNNRIDIARNFAKENNLTVVLKGYNTVITDGNKVYINTTGSSSMAQGGMGDVLTGIISAFAGQKLNGLDAACLAVYIHGYIGDILSKEKYTVKASEIISNIPKYLKKMSFNQEKQ